MAKSKNNGSQIEKRLDTIIRLLEDLFILEAARAEMGRDDIRAVLAVRTERISKIMRGLK